MRSATQTPHLRCLNRVRCKSLKGTEEGQLSQRPAQHQLPKDTTCLGDRA